MIDLSAELSDEPKPIKTKKVIDVIDLSEESEEPRPKPKTKKGRR